MPFANLMQKCRREDLQMHSHTESGAAVQVRLSRSELEDLETWRR
jgi:hypothetical protein